jgi:hypothetical protein
VPRIAGYTIFPSDTKVAGNSSFVVLILHYTYRQDDLQFAYIINDCLELIFPSMSHTYFVFPALYVTYYLCESICMASAIDGLVFDASSSWAHRPIQQDLDPSTIF